MDGAHISHRRLSSTPISQGRGARELDRAISAGARWSRVAATPNPRPELDRLLEGFVERFGSPPISNAGAARRDAGLKGRATAKAQGEEEEEPR